MDHTVETGRRLEDVRFNTELVLMNNIVYIFTPDGRLKGLPKGCSELAGISRNEAFRGLVKYIPSEEDIIKVMLRNNVWTIDWYLEIANNIEFYEKRTQGMKCLQYQNGRVLLIKDKTMYAFLGDKGLGKIPTVLSASIGLAGIHTDIHSGKVRVIESPLGSLEKDIIPRLDTGTSMSQFIGIVRHAKEAQRTLKSTGIAGIIGREATISIDKIVGKVEKPNIVQLPENKGSNGFDFITVDIYLVSRDGIENSEVLGIISKNRAELAKMALEKVESSRSFKKFGIPINTLRISNAEYVMATNCVRYTFELNIK